MFGNTTSFRAALGTVTLPAVGAASVGTVSVAVPGVAPGDIAIIKSIAPGGAPLTLAGSCAVAGTLIIAIANSTAVAYGGAAEALGEAVILRHTGST